MMDQFFAVRHGDYDNDSGRLNREGQRQMNSLANQIAEISGKPPNFYLLSSTAPRTIESAEKIATKLALPSYIKDDLLFSEGEDLLPKARMMAIDRLIEHPRRNFRSVGIVTHWDVAYSYGRHLKGQTGERKGLPEDFANLEKGQALYFDLRSNRFEVLDGRI